MKKLLEFLLEGCCHQWERVAEYTITNMVWRGTQDNIVAEYKTVIYTLECKRCGKLSKHKLVCK